MNVVHQEEGELAVVDRVLRSDEEGELEAMTKSVEVPVEHRTFTAFGAEKVEDEPLDGCDETWSFDGFEPTSRW